MGLLIGMMMMMTAMPNMQAIIQARVRGNTIFKVIDRVPAVRDRDRNLREVSLSEQIRFDNVTFKYPTAPEKAPPVYRQANFEIPAGTSTAIVGPSGSGKSTIVQ